MKMYNGILERTKLSLWKKGLNERYVGSKFFKISSFLYNLLLAYTLFSNLIFIIGQFQKSTGITETSSYYHLFSYKLSHSKVAYIALGIVALFIIGLILCILKKKFEGRILYILPIVFSAIFFGELLKSTRTVEVLWGFNKIYFTRHVIPLALMLIINVILLILICKEKKVLKEEYNKTLDGVYKKYLEINPLSTEKEWEEFVYGCNEESIKNLFKTKS